MKTEEELRDFIRNGASQYVQSVSIDCAIFGYHDQQLKVLVAKYGGLNGWGLPGGFIRKEEKLQEAAHRILGERTGLKNVFLQQFYTFGDNEFRIHGWQNLLFPKQFSEEFGENNWLQERTVSIGYYALIDFSRVTISTDILFVDFNWCALPDMPPLLFDHTEMVEKALATIRNQIYVQPIGYELLPEKFTLPEIHSLYETILNKKLDRRNFPNKLMSLGLLVKLDEKKKIGQHRSPFLYRFDIEKYNEALKNGLALAF